MIQWLYRYVFRGLGVVLLIGMITILVLALSSRMERPAKKPARPAAGVVR